MAEFETTEFDHLFEQIKALPWEDWITEDGKFTVNDTAVNAQLQSECSLQAIGKKAVVERLKTHYQTEWFAETGPVEEAEMRRTFNCGIGMIVCVSPENSESVLKRLHASGENATVIGSVTAG